MSARAILAFLLAPVPLLAADWNPKLAAQYLDGRQKEWFAWPRAASADGPCVSCHTGLPYLVARPALRRVIGEPQPTVYETGLLDRLRAHAGAKPPGALQGVETIFAALFLSGQDDADSPARRSFDQLWSLQAEDGTLKGSARWYSAGLDPWETPAATNFGTALAALALGGTPASYRESPQVQPHALELTAYLSRGYQERSLHSQLALLWASTKLPALLTPAERRSIVDAVLAKQESDGGWTIESFGPWDMHPDAPISAGGSHSYATAFAAYVLERAGTPSPRALDWLRAHQDPQSGAWHAVSMNHKYPAGSMEEKFLQDAATGFAAAALCAAAR